MARRAVINGARAPLRLETADIPETPKNCVRVKVVYSGICHSDLHVRDDDGKTFGVKMRDVLGEDVFNSIVMGHEISGYVDEIGPESDAEKLGYNKGDQVVVYPWQGCQNCATCGLNKPNLCESDAALLFYMGVSPKLPGGYGSHVIVPPKFLVKVPENIPLDLACTLTCSAGTVVSAMKKLEKAVNFGVATSKTKQARLLLIGAGGLGLWAVKLAKAIYKEKVRVMVAEIDPKKIELAKEYGADEGILWSRNGTEEENRDVAIKDGKMHAVVDFIGNTATFQTGSKCLGKNGTIVIVGIHGGEFKMSVSLVVLTGISIIGNIVFDLNEMQEVIDLVSKNNITYPNIRHFALEEVNTALDMLEKGQISGRAVLKHL